MPSEHQTYRWRAQRFEEVQVFFSGDAEDKRHSLGLQTPHEQIRRLDVSTLVASFHLFVSLKKSIYYYNYVVMFVIFEE